VWRFGNFRKPDVKRAVPAIAHTLAVIIWHMFATNKLYTDLGSDKYANHADPAKDTSGLVRVLPDRCSCTTQLPWRWLRSDQYRTKRKLTDIAQSSLQALVPHVMIITDMIRRGGAQLT
jgi:hypothetical protein